MKRSLLVLIVSAIYFSGYAQSLQEIESKKVQLPNGWSLTPVGNSLPLGDLPLNIAVSPSKKLIAVTNNGQSVQSIQLIDVMKGKLLDVAVIPKSWYGLKFSANGKNLYASAGNDNQVLIYAVKNNKLLLQDSILLGKRWPQRISPTGIEIDDARNLLYVLTKENNKLYIVSLSSKTVTDSLPLGGEGYACLLSPDKKELYISCWGCDKVKILDTKTNKFSGEIQTGDNPNELLLTQNGKYLFVANANDNSVSVIDIKQRKILEVLNAALYPDAPAGSTSNGLALSADEKTLYIANADNNCLAVFDLSKPGFSKSKGFIPTGWYPTNIKVIGKKIYVSNGKGFSSQANPYGPNPIRRREEVIYQGGDRTKPIDVQYIGGLFKGTLSIINEPTEKQLGIYSQAVYHNTPYNKEKEQVSKGELNNPIPMKVGDASPIKHVFYIIKENRTYDQVLGDIKEGNGDPSLVLFGEKITPNLHKLVKEFVLLDNFYCDGEVSSDGHEWSMGAYATDYLEKTWPTGYGGRGGNYDGEGMRAVANNKMYIWDQCSKKNISYRTYGEFADSAMANIPVLKNHSSPYYTGWNLAVKDTTRFYQWKREFDSLLVHNAVPQFNTLRFGNDHTEGLRKNKPTPYAHVADNDLAVGMFIEYLSKSPIWKESAVFIIEDDAQNGSDHVDAHRTTAYVAGGFVKRGFVDHTAYSTSSMLRTMELILGLQPMSQYDAAAEPMWRCFTSTPNLTSFTSLPANVDLTEKNMAVNEWQRRSELFNFAKEDAIPDMEFNVVLWYGLKGDHIPMPAPRRAAFLKTKDEKEEDDD
ncbi:MAG TPA: bifunctional YncE family protein/alkaline phosphatase family protein [Chitinophagaceae bacterium]|nr:bifunctional YncE family protein/alkaline phosphatase family protein [Chitinophagaceae bacterium]